MCVIYFFKLVILKRPSNLLHGYIYEFINKWCNYFFIEQLICLDYGWLIRNKKIENYLYATSDLKL